MVCLPQGLKMSHRYFYGEMFKVCIKALTKLTDVFFRLSKLNLLII